MTVRKVGRFMPRLPVRLDASEAGLPIRLASLLKHRADQVVREQIWQECGLTLAHWAPLGIMICRVYPVEWRARGVQYQLVGKTERELHFAIFGTPFALVSVELSSGEAAEQVYRELEPERAAFLAMYCNTLESFSWQSHRFLPPYSPREVEFYRRLVLFVSGKAVDDLVLHFSGHRLIDLSELIAHVDVLLPAEYTDDREALVEAIVRVVLLDGYFLPQYDQPEKLKLSHMARAWAMYLRKNDDDQKTDA
jgi:hypothetical protein